MCLIASAISLDIYTQNKASFYNTTILTLVVFKILCIIQERIEQIHIKKLKTINQSTINLCCNIRKAVITIVRHTSNRVPVKHQRLWTHRVKQLTGTYIFLSWDHKINSVIKNIYGFLKQKNLLSSLQEILPQETQHTAKLLLSSAGATNGDYWHKYGNQKDIPVNVFFWMVSL